MTKRQEEFCQMLAALKGICRKYNAVWNANATFSAAFNDGVATMDDAITAALSQQMGMTGGITGNKQNLRATVAQHLQYVASRTELYATTTGNNALKKDARLTSTAIKKAKDDALVGMSTRITGLATTHLPDLATFGVTAADVLALSTTGASYAALIGAPARQRSVSKEGTKAISALIKTSRAHMAIMDAHMVLWLESDPHFCSDYRNVRKERKPGFRKRSLEISVQDANGAPVAGATFSLPSEKVKRKTSKKGACRIAHLPPGEHRAQVTAEGYAMQEVAFVVAARQTTKLVVVLKPS